MSDEDIPDTDDDDEEDDEEDDDLDTGTPHDCVSCNECGVEFCVPHPWHVARLADGRIWYCPNGHAIHYGESPLAQARRDLAASKGERERLEAELEAVAGRPMPESPFKPAEPLIVIEGWEEVWAWLGIGVAALGMAVLVAMLVHAAVTGNWK